MPGGALGDAAAADALAPRDLADPDEVFRELGVAASGAGAHAPWAEFERAFAALYLASALDDATKAALRGDMDANRDGSINRAEWVAWHRAWLAAGEPLMRSYIDERMACLLYTSPSPRD